MLNRRQFFGNLGVIIATFSAPAILIPKDPINWGRTTLYVPKKYKLKAKWTPELEQDLKAYHGINMDTEMNDLFNYYAKLEIPNKTIISVTKSDETHFDSKYFISYREVYATVMEPII